MEWVETTGKTVDEAKDAALDRLGVAADEAEFDVLEEPKPGLFGRTRGQARVRARVQPTQVRPKNERRRRGGKDSSKGSSKNASNGSSGERSSDDAPRDESPAPASAEAATDDVKDSGANAPSTGSSKRRNDRSNNKKQEQSMSNDEREPSPVTPQEVGDAAVAFMDGLASAFGTTATSELTVDGIELDVQLSGEGLGLMVGPGGRTLNAIQDLTRVSAQRRLGDHDTRLRVDVAGYRARRNDALARFAADVAASVRESGSPRALEPMTSADRKVIHDALNDEEGVSSRSDGDEPSRRVVVVPD